MYHNSGQYFLLCLLERRSKARAGDLSERVGYDLEQARAIAKVQVRIYFVSVYASH